MNGEVGYLFFPQVFLSVPVSSLPTFFPQLPFQPNLPQPNLPQPNLPYPNLLHFLYQTSIIFSLYIHPKSSKQFHQHPFLPFWVSYTASQTEIWKDSICGMEFNVTHKVLSYYKVSFFFFFLQEVWIQNNLTCYDDHDHVHKAIKKADERKKSSQKLIW